MEIKKTGRKGALSFFVCFVETTRQFILISKKRRNIWCRPAFGMGIAFIVLS